MNSLEVNTRQIAQQIENSVIVECEYLDAIAEYFTLFNIDGTILIRPSAMRCKELTKVLAKDLTDRIAIDWNCDTREYTFDSKMNYNEFWEEYYNVLAHTEKSKAKNSALNFDS